MPSPCLPGFPGGWLSPMGGAAAFTAAVPSGISTRFPILPPGQKGPLGHLQPIQHRILYRFPLNLSTNAGYFMRKGRDLLCLSGIALH